MADTLDNIEITANTWVNLYAHPIIVAAGISVGTQISMQNLGETTLRVHAGAAMPTSTSGFREVSADMVWVNDSGDTGAWVLSPILDGLSNVRAN